MSRSEDLFKYMEALEKGSVETMPKGISAGTPASRSAQLFEYLDKKALQEHLLANAQAERAKGIPGQEEPIMSQIEAAQVDDPQTRMRIMAENRFPGMSEEERMGRYALSPEGNILRTGEQGGPYRAEDAGMTGFGVDVAGKWPTIAGGVLGSALGPWGAVGGTMLGEGVRQAIGPTVYGEEPSLADSAKEVAIEGGLSAVPVGAEKLLSAGLRKAASKLGMGPADALSYSPAETSRMYGLSDEFDIPITPAEASGSPSLIHQQRYLQDQPGVDNLRRMYESRSGMGGSVDRAVDDYIARLSPNTPSLDESSLAGYKSMMDALETRKKYRASQSGPHYQKAARDYVEGIDDLATEILVDSTNSQGTPMGKGLKQAYNALTMVDEVTGTRFAKPWVDELHTAREALGSLQDRAKMSGDSRLHRQLTIYKDKLTRLMEDPKTGSKEYQKGRIAHRQYSPPVNAIENQGMYRAVPRKFEPPDLDTFQREIFGPRKSPGDISKARQVIEAQNPEAWSHMVQSHVADLFDNMKSTQGGLRNVAGKGPQALLGSPKLKARLQAMMTPEQFRTTKNFADLLQAVNRVPGSQSQTQPNIAMHELMGRLRGVLNSVLNPQETASRIVTQGAIRHNQNVLSNLIVNSTDMRSFNDAVSRLRRFSPDTRTYNRGKYEDALTSLLAIVSANTAPAAMDYEPVPEEPMGLNGP